MQMFLGTIGGITLIPGWTLLMAWIGSTMHQGIVENALLAWLLMGPVPLFISAPLFWFARSGYSEAKKRNTWPA